MTALPGLLARIREWEIADSVQPSPELLDRVLSTVAAQRRHGDQYHPGD